MCGTPIFMVGPWKMDSSYQGLVKMEIKFNQTIQELWTWLHMRLINDGQCYVRKLSNKEYNHHFHITHNRSEINTELKTSKYIVFLPISYAHP